MKHFLKLTIGLLILASCGQNKNDLNERQIETDITVPIETDNSYKILTETPNVNPEFKTNKCNLEIELKEKISKEKLTSIANELRKTRGTYDNLWIFYYLPGMKIGSIAWATTHFSPSLKVEIIGSTMEEDKKLKGSANSVDGKVVGQFYEKQYTSATYTIYEKNKKTFMKISFKDGSSIDDEMKKQNVPTGTKLTVKSGGSNDEYFILTKSNTLEFYNSENKKFTTASDMK